MMKHWLDRHFSSQCFQRQFELKQYSCPAQIVLLLNHTQQVTFEALNEVHRGASRRSGWLFAEGRSMPVIKPKTLADEFLDELIANRPATVCSDRQIVPPGALQPG
jgi:hypothetical protein